MTDNIIRDKDGAPLGPDWLTIVTEIAARPTPEFSEDNK
jgi:hypothetical protein